MKTDRPMALVTGATRPGRVGMAIAEELARRGCDLVLTHRHGKRPIGKGRAELAAAERGLAVLGATVQFEHVELDQPGRVDAWAGGLAGRLERLDVLVHNASIYQATPLKSVKAGQAHEAFTINAVAPLLISRALAKVLAASPLRSPSGTRMGGAIVTMCDIHAMGELGQSRTNFVAYSMSKAALLELTLVLARELAPKVRVNAVAPGVVAFATDGYESDAAMQAKYLSRVPLGRAGTPREAAEAVAWLALEASYCTGQVIRVDGGRAIT